jgi:predicted AAA+ superfamily ATPase
MFNRIIELSKNRSFFLFGVRGCGKSTLLRATYPQHTYWIDLLDPSVEDQFSRNPDTLKAVLASLEPDIKRIIIDEIQKIPRLLDMVHWAIEQYPHLQFILTGSSARKLRYGGANLLAGRAFFYDLYPFSFIEIEDDFHLNEALQWGLMPRLFSLDTPDEKISFLEAYALLYLKEEIWAEHLIRKIDPFRKFLEVSAQMNGKIINYASIARDVNADLKTVKEYFSILEDTLIGFMLEPFHHSFRKRLMSKPKFYYIDTGLARTLARTITIPPAPSTSYYGELFEQFIIQECWKLTHYTKREWRLSYLRTKDDAEIDLVIERPGLPLLCIEIKSGTHVDESDLSGLLRLTNELTPCEVVCFANVPARLTWGAITVWPWKEGILHYWMK